MWTVFAEAHELRFQAARRSSISITRRSVMQAATSPAVRVRDRAGADDRPGAQPARLGGVGDEMAKAEMHLRPAWIAEPGAVPVEQQQVEIHAPGGPGSAELAGRDRDRRESASRAWPGRSRSRFSSRAARKSAGSRSLRSSTSFTCSAACAGMQPSGTSSTITAVFALEIDAVGLVRHTVHRRRGPENRPSRPGR